MVTEVDYEVLLLVLEIPSSTKTAIETEYTSADEHKRAAVHYFVHNHSYASWRLLILNFDQKYVSGVADKISHLAETLTGIVSIELVILIPVFCFHLCRCNLYA